jgi:hypothetical protein
VDFGGNPEYGGGFCVHNEKCTKFKPSVKGAIGALLLPMVFDTDFDTSRMVYL